MTTAKIVQSRANHLLLNMGLNTWKKDEIRKSDVIVAKNYLNEKEVEELNRIAVMWLDYAEDQAKRRKQVFMNDWQEKFDAFLAFNERDILTNKGSVTKQDADNFAKTQYERFSESRGIDAEDQGLLDNIQALEDIAKKKRDD